MKTVLPMPERLRVHNDLFTQAAEALLTWQDAMNESKVCLTPVRVGHLIGIISTVQNLEPEPQ